MRGPDKTSLPAGSLHIWTSHNSPKLRYSTYLCPIVDKIGEDLGKSELSPEGMPMVFEHTGIIDGKMTLLLPGYVPRP